MRRGLMGSVLSVSCLLLVLGCGGDDGGGPNPVTGVSITPDKTTLEIGHSTGIAATVSGGDSKNLTWFVNDIENGDSQWGTITQNSPAAYAAPDSLPAPATVTIVAVSVEDDTMADTCTVDLEFTKIFVESGTGNDNTGTGSVNRPVKTITKGLTMADAGMTVLVQPGLYDQFNGEVFEFAIPESVALVGMDWETCIIAGHGTGSYNEAVRMDEPAASFRNFTLQMGEPFDPMWSIAILVREDDQVVDSIRVLDRPLSSVLRANNTENVVIQGCYFVIDDGNMWDRGYDLIGGQQDVILRNCTISGFNEGIFINNLQNTLIEGCFITGNNCGVGMWYALPGHNPNPDLGGGARGSIGGNTFTSNDSCGICSSTSNTIYAKFNTWDNDPPVEGEDYCNIGTGSVITE